MTMFNDRERAFEAKYAHDEEFRFLVAARRDKLVADWAADRLRLSGEAKAGLTRSVLAVPDGVGHDDRLLSHLAAAFSDQGISMPSTELAGVLTRYATVARQQLLDAPAVS